MFESGAHDSYQACGTFGFSRKDLKLSEDLSESIESNPTQAAKHNPWKSMQVTKLELSNIGNTSQKHLHGIKPVETTMLTAEHHMGINSSLGQLGSGGPARNGPRE